jgi:hypothetical protein
MFHSIFLGRGAQSGGSGCAYGVQNLNVQVGTYSGYNQLKPFYGLWNYGITAGIYTASQVGTGGKQLTSLQFYPRGFTAGFTVVNQEIWIGEISNSTFPTTTPAVDFSDLTFIKPLTKVTTKDVTISTNFVWINVPFDVPYCYDGTNNLLVVWKNYDGDWTSGFGECQVANVSSRGMSKIADTAFPTGNGTRDNFPLLLRFNY